MESTLHYGLLSISAQGEKYGVIGQLPLVEYEIEHVY